MGISQYDPAAAGRPTWNTGKQVGVKWEERIEYTASQVPAPPRLSHIQQRGLSSPTLRDKRT